MATHLRGRYEEELTRRVKNALLWFGGATGVPFLVFIIGDINLVTPGIILFVVCLCVGMCSMPSERLQNLAEAETQKRIAEQMAFDEAVRKIHRDHKLNQIAQGLVQRTTPAQDPEIAQIKRQYELKGLHQREKTKQIL